MRRFKGLEVCGVVALAVTLLSTGCGMGGGSHTTNRSFTTATPHTVELTWNTTSTGISYKIYRGTVNGGPYTPLASSTQNHYTDSNLTNGTTYYYVVTAIDDTGSESAFSAQASAPIPF